MGGGKKSRLFFLHLVYFGMKKKKSLIPHWVLPTMHWCSAECALNTSFCDIISAVMTVFLGAERSPPIGPCGPPSVNQWQVRCLCHLEQDTLRCWLSGSKVRWWTWRRTPWGAGCGPAGGRAGRSEPRWLLPQTPTASAPSSCPSCNNTGSDITHQNKNSYY